MGHSDEWTFADYFKQEQEIYHEKDALYFRHGIFRA